MHDFLRTDPRRWTEAYDDVVAWLEAQTAALERWLERLPRAAGAQEEPAVGHAAVSLSPLLAQICRAGGSPLEEPVPIAYQSNCEPVVRGEPRSLRHALAALVDHACGQAAAGGVVTVHLHCDTPAATITVTAPGAGIPPDDLPRVFSHSQPAGDAANDHRPGLPFAHDVIVRHGGTIAVESTPGDGITFIARLPLEGNGGL